MSRKGFTIIELLVVVAIIGLLVAILLPAIGKARDSAQTTQSMSNLRNIGSAAGVYGVDFQDRQWGAISEDFGKFVNDPLKWAQSRCAGQLTLGYSLDGSGDTSKPTIARGFFIAQSTACTGKTPSATVDNIKAYWPCDFNKSSGNFGSFRLINAKSFNKYVGGRFYDAMFYAPKDRLVLEQVEALKAKYNGEAEFFGTEKDTILSSYCWSPAAMWSPDVLSATKGFTNPGDPVNAGAFRSPAAGLARFAELKTRCIEHNWLQNKPSGLDPMIGSKWYTLDGANPDQVNDFLSFSKQGGRTGGALPQPWWFNEGSMSAPNALFFDGHVGTASVLDAIDADNRITFQNWKLKKGPNPPKNPPKVKFEGTFVKKGGIPSLANSYQWGCYDNIVMNPELNLESQKRSNTPPGLGAGYHILTVDGILGRDVLNAQ